MRSVPDDIAQSVKVAYMNSGVRPLPSLEDVCKAMSVAFFDIQAIALRDNWKGERTALCLRVARESEAEIDERTEALTTALAYFDARSVKLLEHLDEQLASGNLANRDAITYLKTLDSIKARLEKELAAKPVDAKQEVAVGFLGTIAGNTAVTREVRTALKPRESQNVDPLGNRHEALKNFD